jgi:hypothetical protein
MIAAWGRGLLVVAFAQGLLGGCDANEETLPRGCDDDPSSCGGESGTTSGDPEGGNGGGTGGENASGGGGVGGGPQCPAFADAPPIPRDGCGDTDGISPSAPWPMEGYCPTRHGRSPFVGPMFRPTPAGLLEWPDAVGAARTDQCSWLSISPSPEGPTASSHGSATVIRRR